MSKVWKRYEVDPSKVTHYNQDMSFTTLSQLMRESVRKYGERPFWGIKKDGVYQWMTYSEFDLRMRRMRSLLKKAGLGRGDRLAIIANNSLPFAEAAYAAYGLGAIVVPMYEVQLLADWKYIFADASPKIALVRNDTIRVKIESLEQPGLETIFVINPSASSDESVDALAAKEEPLPAEEDDADPNALCDIIYTSGTTGNPHGVELTHLNVTHNVIVSASMFSYNCNDRILSFLPWAHAFGKTVDFHLFPALGCSIALAESAKTIGQNLLEVNPTVICAVPKIFNKIYEVIHLKLENSRTLSFLFKQAQDIVHKSRVGELSFAERMEYKILDKLVASKVRGAFGNSLNFAVSGGASLSPEVSTFFEDFGVRVFEGYGMTEHSPVISINYRPEKLGSVGIPLPTVKVEIDHENELLDKSDDKCGEIVISSPCVMRGYRNDPGATADAIDAQGRLHTGDMGFIDDEGFIHITGRVKEQYKLANGKYVVPSALEEKINASPDIDCCIVFGAGKPNNVVLIHPSEPCMTKFIKDNGLENVPMDEVEKHPALHQKFLSELQRVCVDFRGYERPQKFAVILEEFTIDNGLLTPALKIKRRAVEKKYADVLNRLYE